MGVGPRALIATFLVWMTAATAGCAIVSRPEYYSPEASGGTGHRDLRSQHNIIAVLRSRGPATELLIENERGRVRVYIPVLNFRLAAIGPPPLPLIPGVLIPPAFRPDAGHEKWTPSTLAVRVGFEEWPERIDTALKGSVLTVIATGEEHRAELCGLRGSTELELCFPDFPLAQAADFDLRLGEIRLEGRPLELPVIRFTKAEGSLWYLGL